MQQRCQGGEHRNVNIGSGANTPGRASRPIEHPGRNLQPSPGCPTREAATENLSASLLNHLMNMDQASGPRMPRIKKLVLRDPVGVPLSCCTTPSERIGRCKRMRRFFVRFNRSESFVHTRSLAGFTIVTSGFEFSIHTGAGEARVPSDDEEPTHPRQCRDDVIHDPVREILLLGVAAHVLEWQDCDRWLIRQRQTSRKALLFYRGGQ